MYIKYVPHFRCQLYLKKVVKKISVCLVSGRYHKSQAIYLESKDNQKLSCVISSVGANEVRTELTLTPSPFRSAKWDKPTVQVPPRKYSGIIVLYVG